MIDQDLEHAITCHKLRVQVAVQDYLAFIDIIKNKINKARYKHLKSHPKILVDWIIREHEEKNSTMSS